MVEKIIRDLLVYSEDGLIDLTRENDLKVLFKSLEKNGYKLNEARELISLIKETADKVYVTTDHSKFNQAVKAGNKILTGPQGGMYYYSNGKIPSKLSPGEKVIDPKKINSIKKLKKDEFHKNEFNKSGKSDTDKKSVKSTKPEKAAAKSDDKQKEKMAKKADSVTQKYSGFFKDKKDQNLLKTSISKMFNGEKLSKDETEFLNKHVRPSTDNDKVYIFKDPNGPRISTSNAELRKALTNNNITGETPNASRFGGKKLVPNKIHADSKGLISHGELNVEKTKNGIKIGQSHMSKVNPPKEKDLIDFYKKKGSDNPNRDAYYAGLNIKKHNELVDRLLSEPELKNLKYLSYGHDPTDVKNNPKIQKEAVNRIHSNISKMLGDHPSKQHKEILDGIKGLSTLKGKEFKQSALSLASKMEEDSDFRSGTADFIESLSFLSQIANGRICMLPAESNYPLGDIISLSGEDLSKLDMSNPKNIEKSLDFINLSVNNISIKKGIGGASSAKAKLNYSNFSGDSKDDMLKITDSFSTTFDDQTGKKSSELLNYCQGLKKKYGIQVDHDWAKTEAQKMVKSIVNSTPKLKDKKDLLTKQWEAYIYSGLTLEEIHNKTLQYQLFSNENWHYSKKFGYEVGASNGTSTLGYMKFTHNVGYTETGRPGNSYASRIKVAPAGTFK